MSTGASDKAPVQSAGPKVRSIPAQAETGVPSERLLLDGVEKAWVKMPNSQRAESPTYTSPGRTG